MQAYSLYDLAYVTDVSQIAMQTPYKQLHEMYFFLPFFHFPKLVFSQFLQYGLEGGWYPVRKIQ